MECRLIAAAFVLIFSVQDVFGFLQNDLQNVFRNGILDINILRCFNKGMGACPHPDVFFHLYSPRNRHGVLVDVRNPLTLFASGFDKYKETVFIVHGFNGTERDLHIRYLRDAYLFRDFNVVTVDWRVLTEYPCYISALTNTRLAAQCAAQMYAFLTHHGSNREHMTCVGHSLGAHICGMVTNHLSIRQHKIIGLDPARPLIERAKAETFRLTRDDADVVQILHTNAGFLGQNDHEGHLNFCINGGRYQPFCKGHAIRRSRCSHFLSICYLANALFKRKRFLGMPCPEGCVAIEGPARLPIPKNSFQDYKSLLRQFKIGNDSDEATQGIYCLQVDFAKHCPFNDNQS